MARRRPFRLLDREWVLYPGVYSPLRTSATAFYSRALPVPRSGTFLEVGCGSGVIAVEAALAGCARVLAVDVDAEAVANTRHNAGLHGAHAVQAGISDVFSAVPPRVRFDTVFWNIPYVMLPADHPDTRGPGRTVFDPGHRYLHAYLSGVGARLAAGGRAFLGFGDIGDHAALRRIAGQCGWRPRLHASGAADPDPHVEHRLYELIHA